MRHARSIHVTICLQMRRYTGGAIQKSDAHSRASLKLRARFAVSSAANVQFVKSSASHTSFA